MSSTAFAEQGQIKQTGFFSGTSKVIGDDKGNLSTEKIKELLEKIEKNKRIKSSN